MKLQIPLYPKRIPSLPALPEQLFLPKRLPRFPVFRPRMGLGSVLPRRCEDPIVFRSRCGYISSPNSGGDWPGTRLVDPRVRFVTDAAETTCAHKIRDSPHPNHDRLFHKLIDLYIRSHMPRPSKLNHSRDSAVYFR